MMYKPTPTFFATMLGIALGLFCMWVLVTLQKHRIEQEAYEATRTCRTLGNKKVPCP